MLDVGLLFPVLTDTQSNAHWLAIQVENRGPASCRLGGLDLSFPPEETQQSSDFGAPDTSQAALAWKQKSQRLAPGAVAHLLLAWSSAPLHAGTFALEDCATHDVMRLYGGLLPEKEPLLEVRHLWMQSCGRPWRSAYRLGPYVAGEPIAKEWLDRYQLKASDFLPDIPRPKEISETGHPPVTLRSLFNVEYLNGTFESGYSGYFELFLTVASPAVSNCAFHSLRKREANGQTLIYLNHCDNHKALPAPRQDPERTRLLLRELHLLPERQGPVTYDVVSQVLHDGKPAWAYAGTEISIRDPKQPMLPTIDTNVPGCLASQLKLTSPPVELGAHWAKPRSYAAPSEQWYDGKVFEFTNTSNQNCMLGGVPSLKFLNPPEETTGFLLPPVCRNCATPLFKPRESGWIELKPGDSAHFMAARAVFDPDYWFLCSVIGGLELTLPGDKQAIRLPFEAGHCGLAHVSAWRRGRYDADPMNIQYDRNEELREKQRTASAPPLPAECAKDVTDDTGLPVMLPSKGPLTWGLSTRPAAYGDEIPVILWLDNPTDKPQPVWTCMNIDWFWLSGILVFDSAGQRVLNVSEEKQFRESGTKPPAGRELMGCTRNFPINIPPHTCMHGIFSQPAYDFVRDLRTYYSLPPGRYFIAQAGADDKPVGGAPPDPANGLSVTVEQQ
jgi:hypothetical protein